MKKQYDDYSKFTVKNIEDNRDPIYGEGFREIKRIVDRKGLNYLLDYISKSN
ncbi:MAG: protein DA1 [Melioribacteraceae bacterium]|nr:protein DA1 [Melioribacteraceae bacterium]